MDKCLLCYCPYQEPKILPCLDSFCFTCLDEHVIKHVISTGTTFPCPVCACDILLPEGGITKFDDNLHVKGEQALQNLTTSGTHPCEVCEETIEAVNRCIECEQNFCANCSKAHLKLKLAQGHTLVLISSSEGRRHLTATAYCDKHPMEELTFYCRTCYLPICLRCRLTNHENHTTVDMVDFATISRKELKQILNESKDFRFSMLNEIEKLRVYDEDIQARSADIKATIVKRKEHFHKYVDRICNEMLERLEKESTLEYERIQSDKDEMETDLFTLSTRIANANQIIDFGPDIEIVRKRQDILSNLMMLRKDKSITLSGVKLELNFSRHHEAETSLRYLIGRLTADVIPPDYIEVEEISTFRVEDSFDVINSICPTPEGKAWIACGWRPEIALYDVFGHKTRSKKVGRDVDCLAIDSDGNSYVSCREEHNVKRFDRNFRKRIASLHINYPRGIACTHDNRLVICVTETTTYFEYNESHKNKVLKLGPDGDESKELKNPELEFKYPIRVAVNTNGDLCVSDNLKHAVMILKGNGELRTSYAADLYSSDVALVKTATPRRKAYSRQVLRTSTPKPVPTSLKPPDSRHEQDGPLTTSRSVTWLDRTPPNSPIEDPPAAACRALAPLHSASGESDNSSVTLEYIGAERSIRGLSALQPRKREKRMDTLSLTEVMTEINFKDRMPAFDPRGIACDRFGHVIVTDYSSNQVHMLDKHGRFLCMLLTEADGIYGPTSVAVDKHGLLWVGGGNATVKVYRYINAELSVS